MAALALGQNIQELVDQVSESRLSDHILALQGQRESETELEIAADYIRSQFETHGYTVTEQSFSYSKNLIARLEGTTQPERVFVIGAHYDTILNTSGADDNASGVAGMLEIARILAGRNLRFTIEFVAFSLEELGLWGSYHYVEQAQMEGKNIIGMINFEMIGYTCDTAGCQSPVFGIADCFEVVPEGVDVGTYAGILVSEASAGLRDAATFATETYVPDLDVVMMQVAGSGECAGPGWNFTRRSDHVPFWEAGIPAIEFFDTYNLRNPNYHTWGDRLHTLDMTFCRNNVQTGLAVVLLQFSGEVILTGPGPGGDNPTEVRGFLPGDTGAPALAFQAYGVNRYGVNVAAGRIDGVPGDEIITGPGPGEVFGPHVRVFHSTGSPVPGASFFAYGTNRFGVNVAAGDLDGDGREEIITGAGPGEAFGPHVRAFSLSGGTVNPVPGVNYFAYGTLKYGVNVSCGDLDGDGTDEIITGAGPGAVFGPHVRGWNVDGGAVAPLAGVSYFAYGTLKYGVKVACGDLDGDGIDEIITGAGPGVIFGPHVRGWNVDGGTAAPIPGVSFFAYEATEYGVEVGAGDLDGDGFDEILTGPGPGPEFGARVRGWNYDGTVLTAMPDVDFLAYPTAVVTHGAKIAFLED